jgi:hypothetical protein
MIIAGYTARRKETAMSAIEQMILEHEAANRIREAHDFADRERLFHSVEPASVCGQVIRWAILCLVVVGLAFVIFLA